MQEQNFEYVLLVIGTLVVAIIVSTILRKLVSHLINKNATTLKADPTNFYFLKNALPFLIYAAALLFILLKIPGLRNFGAALFAGAGVFAAVLGFASQKAFANIISGVFILIFKPFKVNDWIILGEKWRGWVEEITLRHTVIKDMENQRIIVPNSVISDETIINSHYLEKRICKKITFGISYDSDISRAIDIIISEAQKHPLHIDYRTDEDKAEQHPDIPIRVGDWADSSIPINAYIWAGSPEEANLMKSDLLQSVKKKFEESNIEIPYPHRTVVQKQSGKTI
ncbi:MAG: mechanosensitive ion channel family protein [Bacteroidia bacterium]|nr:mechanosensitive ion channel family protein [Bacteroidia bacterium]